MQRIKTNDLVMIITGKYKGKQGEVLAVDLKANRVQVRGINLLTHFVKPKKQGDVGGIVKQEGFIHMSNVMPICKTTNKPCRVNARVIEGKKIRVSSTTHHPLS